MESHYLTKETKQQTKTGTTTQKSYAMHSATPPYPQNTTFCGSKMTICGTAAVQTDTQKTFLFEKKVFHLTSYTVTQSGTEFQKGEENR